MSETFTQSFNWNTLSISTDRKMEIKNNLSWWSLYFLLSFISQSAGQSCFEFFSPENIDTSGTSVGTIQVPKSGAGNYRSNQICEWNIETSISGFGIRLDVKESNLQDRSINNECSNDYVDIFDFLKGESMFMDRFCGSENGKSYLTTGNKMTIRFHSDAYLEFTGFEAMYQAVPAGPSKDQQDEDSQKTLDMAVGIPVGILTLAIFVIATLAIIRYCRRKKAARQSPSTALTQNSSVSRRSLPFEYHPSDTVYSTEPPGYTQDQRADSNVFFNRNGPLHVQTQGGSASGRSVTPPPAYDSLDFNSGEVEHSSMPLTPPPYEVIAKQRTGPSNG